MRAAYLKNMHLVFFCAGEVCLGWQTPRLKTGAIFGNGEYLTASTEPCVPLEVFVCARGVDQSQAR